MEKVLDKESEDRIARVSRLPESYLIVLEQVVDGLKKDLFNRLVYGQYIDDLCDKFEKAIAEGKQVEDVVGNDIPAFIIQYQKDVDFRDLEPTKENKLTNKILSTDFITFVGINILVQALREISDGNAINKMSCLVLIIGVIFFVGSFIYKIKQYKKLGMSYIPIGLQIGLTCIVCYFLNFEIITTIISFGIIVILDFIELSNYRKRKNKERTL